MGARVRRWFCVLAFGAATGAAITVVRADISPADVFLQAGDLLTRDWHYRDALAMYGRAERVAEGPQRVRATLGVAASAVRLAEFELAYAKAASLRRDYPDDLEVCTIYGQAAWSAGLFDEAERSFARVLQAWPDDPRARLGMARVLTARNQLAPALEHALAAALAAPQDAEACNVVAFIYRRLGRLDQAIVWYSRYQSMLPRRESDKRLWTQGELRFLRSFGRDVPAEIDPGARGVVHAIPFRLVNDKVIVKGRVNGTDWVDFVLDTGAEQTVLSATSARRLGIEAVASTISAGVGEVGLRGLQHARLESLQVGSLLVRNVPCLIKTPPLRDLPVRESENFSPLALGLSVVVDYTRRELLLASDLGDLRHDVELPMWYSRLATVRGLVNGERPASFIVDTGGEVVSISTDTARTLSVAPGGRRVPLLVFGTSGWDREAYLLPNVGVSFDSVPVRSSSLVVLNLRAPSILLGYRVGGTMGHAFLRDYRVTIDLKRGVLGLTRAH